MSNSRKIFLFVALPLVVIFGLVAWRVTVGSSRDAAKSNTSEATSQQSGNGTGNDSKAAAVTWQSTGNGWQATSTPPACADPLNLPIPAKLSLITSILYPGQTRGGNYKPHGGFRFDNSKNADITVTAPLSGQVVQAARYLVGGETQYMFDIMTDCGIMYRLGHLLTLAPKYATIANSLPAAVEGDSRTQFISPQVAVTAGETIATAVGVTVGGVNTFFDFGVYNYNAKNAISADPTWAAQHKSDSSIAPYAVCWFDLLTSTDNTAVRALPAGDPQSGKTSDYCK